MTTLEQMIAEVKREVAMRELVYPRLISWGRVPKEEADRRIEVMKAVLTKLQEEKEAQAPQLPL